MVVTDGRHEGTGQAPVVAVVDLDHGLLFLQQPVIHIRIQDFEFSVKLPGVFVFIVGATTRDSDLGHGPDHLIVECEAVAVALLDLLNDAEIILIRRMDCMTCMD